MHVKRVVESGRECDAPSPKDCQLLLHFMHVKRVVESGRKCDAPSPKDCIILQSKLLQCGLLQKSFAYSAYAHTYAHMGIFRYYWVTLFPYLTPNFHIISSENQYEQTLNLRMPQNKTLQNCFCFVERGVVE
jgi:hypothetical protein